MMMMMIDEVDSGGAVGVGDNGMMMIMTIVTMLMAIIM